MIYDVAVIGTGPAGLSAALTLKLHNKSILWFGSKELSDKVGRSEKIANYPGLPFVSGADLNEAFRRQLEEMELQIEERMVSSVAETKNGFMLLADNEVFDAKTVLFAIGAVSAKGLPGETEYLGRGVSYCATCDGFLYRGKTLAVLCYHRRYEHEIAYLAELADKLYVYAPFELSGLPANAERLPLPVSRIGGERKVKEIGLTDGSVREVDGVFIMRDAIAAGTLLKGLETEGPHIAADKRGCTNRPGCFAAGDCTGRPYQIAKAVGEGNVAAHSILEFLDGRA